MQENNRRAERAGSGISCQIIIANNDNETEELFHLKIAGTYTNHYFARLASLRSCAWASNYTSLQLW